MREIFLLPGVFCLTLLSYISHSTASATNVKDIFFTLRRFLPYTPSRNLAQPAFINASLGTGSSSSKVAGPPTEIQKTDLAHMFVSIPQRSAKGISR